MAVPPPIIRELEAGLQAHRAGQFESALSHYQRALGLQPDNADALNLSGVALQQLGQLDGALAHLREAARLRRNDSAILANLGQVYAALNRHSEAEEAYRKASRIDPRQPNYQMGLANALAQQGQHAAAQTLFERLTQRHPELPLLWFNRGNLLRNQGRLADAADSFRRALALNANDLDTRNNLAGVLHALLRFDEAEREYRACLDRDAHYFPACASLASLLIDVARDAEAESVCRTALQLAPDRADVWLMLASAQNHQGRVDAQLETMRAAAARWPHDAAVVNAYAAALFNAGEFAEAMRMSERAQTQALAPGGNQPQAFLAGALQAYGYLEAGWLCYRQRPARAQFLAGYPQVTLAETLPSPLHGAPVVVDIVVNIVVLSEQGLGDELFFLRYAPLLAEKGARITYRAGAKLQTLLERAPCLQAVLPAQAAIPAAEYVMLAGDLPAAITPVQTAQDQLAAANAPGQAAAVSASDRYPPSLAIAPLPERVSEMRQRLAAAGPAPYLALTWRAGTPAREQGAEGWSLYKATAIADFAQAVGAFPGTLLALQRNPAPGEIAAVAEATGRPVQDFSDLNDNLEGMLALLALIDEYAGVSNTNMHLRALAGKTARVLLPAPAEWRWMQSGDASPWFPGFSLYRQAHDGSWQAAWAALRRDLSQTWPAR